MRISRIIPNFAPVNTRNGGDMKSTVTRRQTTVRLPDYMLADISAEARRQGISVSRLIENRMEESLYKPNKETLEALEETRRGEYAGVVDTSSFEAFMKSFDE